MIARGHLGAYEGWLIASPYMDTGELGFTTGSAVGKALQRPRRRHVPLPVILSMGAAAANRTSGGPA